MGRKKITKGRIVFLIVALTVLIIYVINAMFSAVSVLYAIGKTDTAIFLYALLIIIVLIFIFKTDILYKHTKNETKEK